jgi:maltose-binding protein MalE
MKLKKVLYCMMAVVLLLAFVATGCAPAETTQTAEAVTTEAPSTEASSTEEAVTTEDSQIETFEVPEEDTTITMWMLQEVDAYTQSIKRYDRRIRGGKSVRNDRT